MKYNLKHNLWAIIMNSFVKVQNRIIMFRKTIRVSVYYRYKVPMNYPFLSACQIPHVELVYFFSI